MDATNDNLERDGARQVRDTEETSEEHHNSLAIVVYTGPLKVAPPTQEAVDDAEIAPRIVATPDNCSDRKRDT
ncbi:hypothetical protein PVK06_039767 [Gossypium arboreum]|uniref:Uncharacterized protein n=1 Tax=Gossypium arboreum TaxID=29729 RepID=A0ABR0N3S4_GOSAR|nr:hypothetical protein PVK06_039767 [Gossypium arboreum]